MSQIMLTFEEILNCGDFQNAMKKCYKILNGEDSIVSWFCAKRYSQLPVVTVGSITVSTICTQASMFSIKASKIPLSAEELECIEEGSLTFDIFSLNIFGEFKGFFLVSGYVPSDIDDWENIYVDEKFDMWYKYCGNQSLQEQHLLLLLK